MIFLSFALVTGFYFWLGPMGIVLLTRWLFAKKNIHVAILSFAGIAGVSWCITALLAYCVSHWTPGALPDNVLQVAFHYGWLYLFVTSIPAMVLFGLSAFVKQSSKKRIFVGCAFASVPYFLLLYWGGMHL